MPLSVIVYAARPVLPGGHRRLGFAVAAAGAMVLTLVTAAGLARLSEASEARLEGPIAGLLPQLWPDAETAAPETLSSSREALPNAIDEAEAGPPYKRK